MPAHLRHGRMAHPAVPATPIPTSRSHAHDQVSPSASTRTYSMGCSSTTRSAFHQPCDFPPCRAPSHGGTILASTRATRRPGSPSPTTRVRSPSPMSASARRARRRPKYWNNPNGWREIVAFLKEHGYRVSASTRSRARPRPRVETTFPMRRGRDRPTPLPGAARAG